MTEKPPQRLLMTVITLPVHMQKGGTPSDQLTLGSKGVQQGAYYL